MALQLVPLRLAEEDARIAVERLHAEAMPGIHMCGRHVDRATASYRARLLQYVATV